MVLWWMNALPGNTEPFSMGEVQAHLDGHGSGVDQGVGLAGFHPLGRNAPDFLDEFRGEYLQRGPGGHDAAGIEDDDVVADPRCQGEIVQGEEDPGALLSDLPHEA